MKYMFWSIKSERLG
jgi:hypothetical protein